jgi:thiol:disulfide interchange protein
MRCTPLLPALLALAVTASGAAAQQKASAKLFTRVEGDQVSAAIEVAIDAGYHLYHDDLGDYVGEPTAVEGLGEDVEWTSWTLPKPKSGYDPFLEQFYDKHEGTIVIRGEGLFLGGDPDAIAVRITGQTCDDRGCVPYEQELETLGAGADALFAAATSAAGDLAQGPAGGGATSPFGGFDAAGPSGAADQKASFEADLQQDGATALLTLTVTVEEGYHLYGGPTLEDVAPGGAIAVPTTVGIDGAGVEWAAPRFPKAKSYPGMNEDFEDIEVAIHEGTFTIEVPGTVRGEVGSFEVRLAGQTCNDSTCVDYSQSATVVARAVPVGSLEAAAPEAAAGPGDEQSAEENDASDEPPAKPLGPFLLEALLWGLITLLMPCTYPMIPITISFFTKQAIARDGNVLSLSLSYGAGIVLVFILIGVVIGAPIQEFANNPIFNLFIAAMFVFFAFSLFGWFNLQPPAFLMQAAGKASTTGGLLGVFMMGLTLVITSFTCTAPFVGTLLARGGDQGVMRVVLGMGVFGLTMATPFVFLSLFPSRAQKMPGAGAWMNTLKVFLGFVELAAALKFVSTADLAYGWGLLSKEVFLILWAGIFAVASMFLLGKINLKGEESGAISPGRMVGGTMTFLFAIYCAFLTFGFRMDPLLTAFAPPYSSAPVRTGAAEGGEEDGHGSEAWAQVVDDWDGAVARARAADKLLLVNFTGFN